MVKNIVKGVGITITLIGAISMFSQHPVLVIMMLAGAGAFYVADKIL